jgi:hypothetical protein
MQSAGSPSHTNSCPGAELTIGRERRIRDRQRPQVRFFEKHSDGGRGRDARRTPPPRTLAILDHTPFVAERNKDRWRRDWTTPVPLTINGQGARSCYTGRPIRAAGTGLLAGREANLVNRPATPSRATATRRRNGCHCRSRRIDRDAAHMRLPGATVAARRTPAASRARTAGRSGSRILKCCPSSSHACFRSRKANSGYVNLPSELVTAPNASKRSKHRTVHSRTE